MATVETNTVTLTVNGREVTVPKGFSVVEAAAEAGIEIPVFCYEPRLGAGVGACRMCLCEIEGMPKLQTACTTPAADGMVVDSHGVLSLAGAGAVGVDHHAVGGGCGARRLQLRHALDLA